MKAKFKKKTISVVSGFSFIILCFNILAPHVFAEDFTKYYHIVSPKNIEKIMYGRMTPPFKIKAPQGWYMAMANEDVPNVDRAIFCKEDPTEPFSQGKFEPFDFAYMKIAFLPNLDEVPAIVLVDDFISQVEATGTTILFREELTVDNKKGGHFTSPVPGMDLMMDTYIFTSEKEFISIKTICKQEEFEYVEPEIKEAINSIKFSLY
jgi:hypothetical protein